VIQPGDVLLARFPFTDLSSAKLRPVVVLAPVPGPHDDYLVAFVSSQLQQAIPGVDVAVDVATAGFESTGLKVSSLIRVGKIATLARSIFVGRLGELPHAVMQLVIDKHVALLRGEL
jgi:mRNA interferase MazF